MGTIKISNIRLYANHGCLKEENSIGSDYRVDVELTADLSKPADTDQLSDTVDYVTVHKIVKEEMMIRSKLLEHVANRIKNRIFAELKPVKTVSIAVSKINPPIGGDVEAVAVVLEGQRN